MVSDLDISKLVGCELVGIQDGELAACIQQHLVAPYVVSGRWQYGAPGKTYPCWVVLKDSESGTAVVFSEFGFAPAYPWGIMVLADLRMGMDCDWHVSLEQAVRNCPLWAGRNPPDYEIP
jgi:hypothetical protein